MTERESFLEHNRFKNNSGKLLLRALFFETTMSNKDFVIYTLKTDDYQGYPSLYRLYMAMDDPTEYEFAITYFDGWEHWKRLCECVWFKPFIARWREELDTRIKSKALRQVKQDADSGSFQANKLLIDRTWETTGPKVNRTQVPRKIGRPSDAEVKGELKRIALDKARIDNDFKRILGDGSKTE